MSRVVVGTVRVGLDGHDVITVLVIDREKPGLMAIVACGSVVTGFWASECEPDPIVQQCGEHVRRIAVPGRPINPWDDSSISWLLPDQIGMPLIE